MQLNFLYRWQNLAEQMIDDLAHGTASHLPGVQALGRQYHVSRVTVERALHHLEQLGVLLPAQRGMRRKINRKALKALAKSRGTGMGTILYICDQPLEKTNYLNRKIFETLRKACDREDLRAEFYVLPKSRKDLQNTLRDIRPIGAITVSLASSVTESIQSMGIRTVGYGCNSPRIKRFNTSYSELIMAGLQKAWAAGHRRVSMPIWNKPEQTRERLIASLAPFFQQHGISFSPAYHLPSFHGDKPADYQQGLTKLFSHTPPSCLIVGNFFQYLMVSSYLMHRGLKVPADVSLISLSEDPNFEHIHPSIAHFKKNSLENISTTLDYLLYRSEHPDQTDETLVKPIWVKGESLATL